MSGIVRLGILIGLIAGLLYIGWDKPYQEWVQQITGRSRNDATQQPPAIRQPTVSTTPSGGWVHDPNHHTVLDKPAMAHSAPQPVPSGSGSWLFDHRSSLDAPKSATTPH
ncbi:MAG TPA: hypothetical protein VGM62_03820 [Chthoniobacterales bacterium]|jgi:hypothetical protein